jgi:hypothetical protein
MSCAAMKAATSPGAMPANVSDSECAVPAREFERHDAGADHRRKQESRTAKFSSGAAGQRIPRHACAFVVVPSMRAISFSRVGSAAWSKAVERKSHEGFDAEQQQTVSLVESFRYRGRRALNLRRIGDAPMRRRRFARPERAEFASSVIADREDEIDLRRTGFGELLP